MTPTPLTLWAETDDALLPPLGRRMSPTVRAEYERLLKKIADIRECVDTSLAGLARQQARLERLEVEVDRLEREVDGA